MYDNNMDDVHYWKYKWCDAMEVLYCYLKVIWV